MSLTNFISLLLIILMSYNNIAFWSAHENEMVVSLRSGPCKSVHLPLPAGDIGSISGQITLPTLAWPPGGGGSMFSPPADSHSCPLTFYFRCDQL